MSNYRNGRDLEWAARAELQRQGWLVIRSAGSKQAADLIAAQLPPWDGHVRVIQCKTDGYLRPAERARLRETARLFRAVPVVASWVKEGRAARKVALRELEDER